MSATAPFWGWARGGRRWHLRTGGADRALCGAGARGWAAIAGWLFDPTDIDVRACLPCLRVEKQAPPSPTVDAAVGGG